MFSRSPCNNGFGALLYTGLYGPIVLVAHSLPTCNQCKKAGLPSWLCTSQQGNYLLVLIVTGQGPWPHTFTLTTDTLREHQRAVVSEVRVQGTCITVRQHTMLLSQAFSFGCQRPTTLPPHPHTTTNILHGQTNNQPCSKGGLRLSSEKECKARWGGVGVTRITVNQHAMLLLQMPRYKLQGGWQLPLQAVLVSFAAGDG